MVNRTPGLGVSSDAAGPCRILLLAALPLEVRPFLRLSRARRRRGLPWPAWEFALGAVRGLLAVSGMGQNAVREAASRLVAQFRPHLVVSLGFGGALSPELHHGDLVLGEFFGRYDPVTQVLDPLTPAPAPPRPLPELLRPLTAAGLAAFAGRLITTPWIIHKGRQGGGLAGSPLVVLDLESAAVAQVAWSEGLPFLGLRAITDAASEEIPDFLAPVGREPGQVGVLDALGWLAADPRRLVELVRLWRHSRLAANRLAGALMVLLPQLESP
jgi:nucleoside phosphorylase